MGIFRFVFHIITGPSFGVRQGPVGPGQLSEFLGITGTFIVRMIAPGQQPVNPFNGFLVRLLTQLKNFVIIDESFLFYMLDLNLAASGIF